MRDSGFDLGSSLVFLLALSLGAVLGSLVTAWGATRIGPIPTAVMGALAAGTGLTVLLLHPPSSVAYGALVLAGVGTHGVQCLIIAAVVNHYPPHLRGTALGFSLGFGRIGAVMAPQAGGWLLAAGLGVNSNFLAFALAAAVAGVFLMLCPRPPRLTDTAGVTVGPRKNPRVPDRHPPLCPPRTTPGTGRTPPHANGWRPREGAFVITLPAGAPPTGSTPVRPPRPRRSQPRCQSEVLRSLTGPRRVVEPSR
ncbi:hypothetical protein SHKM778_48640 [Streptomyces sp. KM77-8]|uniref:Major facilitator superfamily (MFS) profile domain-containing protein n=1 Tax=Streptomyces haneummycinicus TaxID=3074435 RepID=A0AAT9HLT1_9ACTN